VTPIEDPTLNKNLAAQRDYIARMQQAEFDFSLMVADAFVRGIRDIGYRSTATAIDELIDNSDQADATMIQIAFAFAAKSDAKPSALAVLDNGHGMDPAMIRMAVTWGGTHREGDRSGFGRYGYGLPSASISQGKKFSVYSRTEPGGTFYAVTIDVTELGKGKYNVGNRVIVPAAERAELPAWVVAEAKHSFGKDLAQLKTVVIIDELDRLTWKTATALERNLLEHFGVVYRNYLGATNILVNRTQVEPVDPLFLTDGARFYDLDDDRAESLDPLLFDVKDPERREVVGSVKVRYAYMPPTFQRADKSKERGKMNKRFEIMKEHNGIIVLRNGRQIDVVTRCPWTTFTIYDRNWGVEVDFPPTLDEEFSITTSKQQVVLSDRIWELMREQGVWKAIQGLRKRFDEDSAKQRARLKVDKNAKRMSEQAMEEAEPYKTRKAAETDERVKQAAEGLDKEAKRRATESHVPEDIVREQLITETQTRPYKVEEARHPGAPFFWLEQRGGQKVLVLNSAHRFYVDVYAAQESNPRLQAALEVVLFVIGDAELDATPDRQLFYKIERNLWSTQLEAVLDRLDRIVPATTEPTENADDIEVEVWPANIR